VTEEEEMDPFVVVRQQLKELQDRQRRLNEKGFKKGYGEGFKEGHKEEQEEMLAEMHAFLLDELEKRFGDLPPETRKRVEWLKSFERIVKLGFAVGSASSLVALEAVLNPPDNGTLPLRSKAT
jgi:flagellar biosynthesis/type III secretory pathway protein FliH